MAAAGDAGLLLIEGPAGIGKTRLAAHLLAMPSSGEPWVADALEHAARTALAKGAGDSAITYLKRSLDEPLDEERRARILFDLGRAEGFTNGMASVEYLRAAFRAGGDAMHRARVAVELANTLTFTNHLAEAVAVVDEGAALVRGIDRDLEQRFQSVRLGVSFFDTSVVPLDDAAFLPYRGPLTGDGPRARALAALAAYHWGMRGGSAAGCAELALRAIEDGQLLEAENGGLAHGGAFFVLVMADRDEVIPFVEASMEASHRSGSLWARSAALAFGAIARSLRGQLEDVTDLIRANREIHEIWGGVSVEPILNSQDAHIAMNRGDFDHARRMLDAVGLGAEIPPGNSILSWFAAARLRLLVETRADEEALAYSETCERRLRDLSPNPAWMPWRSLRAKALDRMDRREEAIALAEEELALARAWGSPRVVGVGLRILGTSAAPTGYRTCARPSRSSSPRTRGWSTPGPWPRHRDGRGAVCRRAPGARRVLAQRHLRQ